MYRLRNRTPSTPSTTQTRRQTANSHLALNTLVLLLQAVNIGYRASSKNHGVHHYWKNGWILSLVSVVVLGISGWLGGWVGLVCSVPIV